MSIKEAQKDLFKQCIEKTWFEGVGIIRNESVYELILYTNREIGIGTLFYHFGFLVNVEIINKHV